MTYAPIIYDWRRSLRPNGQLFTAGGSSVQGGLTLGGASVETPAIGGRASLSMQFTHLPRAANVDASWTYSRARNGSVFRIPIRCTDQLVSASDLNPPDTDGIPWANVQPWANGENWDWNPTATVSAALKGTVQVTVDLSEYGQVIRIGHVVGFTVGAYDFAHIVMDIQSSGDDATLTLDPPLRRSISDGDSLRFRPSMLAVCRNPGDLAGMFEYGRYTQPGAALFVEALV